MRMKNNLCLALIKADCSLGDLGEVTQALCLPFCSAVKLSQNKTSLKTDAASDLNFSGELIIEENIIIN